MNTRPRVLIPSDNFAAVANLVGGYRDIGYDVTGGHLNFELESAGHDIVHLLWPEEFTGWRAPGVAQIDAVLRRLDRWAMRSRLIISVNNLYPHRYPEDPLFQRLYTGFYERAEVIHHASKTSRRLVCAKYPSIAGRNHIVRLGFNYERLLPPGPRDRAAARRAFGIAPEEMVFLSFGSLRHWEEVRVLRQAFALARVPKRRLLITSHYVESGPVWRQRWRQWQWRRLQRSDGVRFIPEWITDEEMPNLFDAVDAVIVLRHNSMSSGVPSLAMTFGRFIIASNSGAMPEYLDGTGNVLFEGTSAAQLAGAMEFAFAADRERVGAENARIAAAWGWTGIVKACLDALPRSEKQASYFPAQN
jgi:glycosyltransferase involved in cell wall biosynthesis